MPLLPPPHDDSRLAQRIRRELAVYTWATPLLSIHAELRAPPLTLAPPVPMQRVAEHVTVPVAVSLVELRRGAILSARRLAVLLALFSSLVVVLLLAWSLDAHGPPLPPTPCPSHCLAESETRTFFLPPPRTLNPMPTSSD